MSVVVNTIAVLAAFFALCVKDGAGAITIGVIVTLCPMVAVVLREHADSWGEKGDVIRMLVLISDSLGNEISAKDEAIVRGWSKEELAKTTYIAPYYSSPEEPGARRLADNLAESAYFSMVLAGEMAFYLGAAVALVGMLLLAMLYVLGSSSSGGVIATGVQGAVIVVTAIIGGDSALLLRRFVQFKGASKKAFEAASKLRESGAPLEEVFVELLDYEGVRKATPPIPSWLYRLRLEKINDDFRKSHQR